MRKTNAGAIGGVPGPSWHALAWVETEPVPAKHGGDGLAVRAVARRLWGLELSGRAPSLYRPIPFGGPGELATILPQVAPRKRRLTVWLSHGWESLVLAGLAELMESGLYRYSWCTLDGAKVLIRGRLGNRGVDVTSLANWTGGEWDGWRQKVERVPEHYIRTTGSGATERALLAAGPDERCALATVVAVLQGIMQLRLGPARLSVGAQSRSWWRAWGGPRLAPPRRPGRSRAREKQPPRPATVPPLTNRPLPARNAEAHCCFGLVREQYWCGQAGGPVHVVDLRCAYLVGLAYGNLPAAYSHTLISPPVKRLSEELLGRAGCALVLLRGTEHPYCVKDHARPLRAVGTFWTWLTEPELARALYDGAVAECATAHVWRHIRHPALDARDMMEIGPGLARGPLAYLGPLWRQIYSARVGSWAAKAYRWEDDPRPSQLGKWATWTQAGPRPGEVEHWRCVAGRVQRRVFDGEAPHALPLAYATVTAMVRDQVDYLRSLVPAEHVLATACDALWLTEAGLLALRNRTDRTAESLGRWAVKETFDDAWLDGKGGAVVRRGDDLYPLQPGIPAGVAFDDDLKARWPRAADWTDRQPARADRPRKRYRVAYDGGRLVRACSHPLIATESPVLLNRPELPERLLLAYEPLTVASEDD